MNLYKKILNKLDFVLSSISAALFFIIFVVILTEIFCRGVLGFSLLWTVEFSRILGSWTLLLGASVIFHRNDHLVIDLFTNSLSPNKKRILEIITTITTLILMIILLFNGLKSASSMMNMRFTTLGWRMGYLFYALPAFAFFSIIFLMEKIIYLIKGEIVNE